MMNLLELFFYKAPCIVSISLKWKGITLVPVFSEQNEKQRKGFLLSNEGNLGELNSLGSQNYIYFNIQLVSANIHSGEIQSSFLYIFKNLKIENTYFSF